MTIPSVGEAAYPTPDEVLAAMLNETRMRYAALGITVNVAKGTELYERMKVIAGRVSIAMQNNKLALADVSPIDATGDALVEQAGIYGVTKAAAQSASGFVTAKLENSNGGADYTLTIPAGFTCTSPTGIQYSVVSATAVTYFGNDTTANDVPVIALTGGASTSESAGVVVTWDSAALGDLVQTAVVGAGGITGGADKDGETELRAKFLTRLSAPSIGGNAAQVAQFAEAASAAVWKAFVYQAARGPASYDVAVLTSTGVQNFTTVALANIASYVLGQMPGTQDLNLTGATAEQLDIVIDATLPLPVSAGGAGGGWRDTAPWPSSAEASGVYAEVTAVGVVTNTVTVDSTAADPPVAGKRFGLWDYTAGEMKEFTIVSVGGAPGAYIITVDSGQSDALSFAEIGMRCSAGAVNLKQYATAFKAAMALLGPGEKTTSADRLPRARREPTPEVSHPSDLSTRQLYAIISAYSEVMDLSYKSTTETGTATTRTSPSVPLTVADPPKVLTVKHLSFRRQV